MAHEDPNEALDIAAGRPTQTRRVIRRLLSRAWVSKYELTTEIGTQAMRRLQELRGEESEAKIVDGFRYFIAKRTRPGSRRNEQVFRLWRIVDVYTGAVAWSDEEAEPDAFTRGAFDGAFPSRPATLF